MLFDSTPVVLWIALAASNVYASSPCSVPLSLATTASLQTQYAALVGRANDLNAAVAAFNTACNVQNPEGSPAEVACAQRETELRSNLASQSQNVKLFHQLLVSDLTALSSKVRMRMAVTAARMRNLTKRSATYLTEANEWVAMGESARQKAIHSAITASLAMAADGVGLNAHRSADLHEDSIKRFEQWYAGYGQLLPASQRANVLANVKKAKTAEEFAGALSRALGLLSSGTNTADAIRDKQDLEALEEGSLGLLQLAQSFMRVDPEVNFALSSVQMSVDDTYGWWAVRVSQKQANRFLDLEDSNLAAIDSMGALYVRDANLLIQVRSDQASLTGSTCFAKLNH